MTSSFTQRSGSRFLSMGDRSDTAFSGANLNAAEFAAFRKEPPRFRSSSTPIRAQNDVIALDDSIASARDIAVGSTAITINDFVGTADPNDYFRFTLTQNSTFRMALSGLTADADVMLLNSSGSVIGGSKQSGTTAESINRQLGAGTYYLRVYPFSDGTNYSMRVSAIVTPVDNAGNTLDTARNITVGSTTTSFRDYVGRLDTNDYYKFTLNSRTNLNLTLGGLAANADVELLDSNGWWINGSYSFGTAQETIGQELDAGTYYIRVAPAFGTTASTNYQLDVSAGSSGGGGFSSVNGFGLVNAAAAVARARGEATPFPSVPDLGGNDWGADLINAPEVWARGFTGQGITVAVLDTGVDRNHPDLRNNMWRNSREIAGNGLDDDNNGFTDDVNGWSFATNNNDTMDRQSHGTHVAGTIAGTRNTFGVTGIAYDARIMPVKVLGDTGSGSFSSIARGIRYAADNGADVINMSLGADSGSSVEINDAIRYASERGAIVVTAAGNSSLPQPGYPANTATQWGITVGAIDRFQNMASFSNRAGTNSQMRYVTAPGVGIYSTTPNNTYQSFNGTSMAAPHVAGMVALMLSAKGDLTDAQVREIVTQTAGNVLSRTGVRSGATLFRDYAVTDRMGRIGSDRVTIQGGRKEAGRKQARNLLR